MVRARAILAPLLAASVAGPAVVAAGEQGYTVVPDESAVRIHVGKSGLFGFAGHEHEVVAPAAGGTVVADPADLARSSVTVSFDAAALEVTGEGEPAKDVPKVQAKMVGPEVLDAARFQSITFRSRSVAGREVGAGVYELQVTGELDLHGVSRSMTLPLRVELAAGTLTATGKTTLRQTDFGMKPVSAGAGTVKVKNEIGVDFRIVARAGR
jgi:polyisoprenoid-binding protein YceI